MIYQSGDMGRRFTAISMLSMAISFLAAVVLCTQVAQMKAIPEWEIKGISVWILEIAIFGVAVYAWQNSISFGGWLLGILSLLMIRMALSASAALGMSALHSGEAFSTAMSRMDTLLPRLCATIFALMVCYPIRVFLPIKQEHDQFRAKRKSSDEQFENNIEDHGDPTLVFVRGDEKIPVWQGQIKAAGVRSADITFPVELLNSTLELPLGTILAQLPRDLVGKEAAAYDPMHPVSIPMGYILPQLQEAKIEIGLLDLHDWLPPGAMRALPKSAIGSEGEGDKQISITIPLQLIIPLLSEEVFELPAPSPPIWAELDESDIVLFATI